MVVSLAHFIPNDLAILIIFSLFGYVLSSVDLLFLFEKFFTKIANNTIYPAETKTLGDQTSKSQQKISHLNWKDWLFHLFMILFVLASSIIPFELLYNTTDYTYIYRIQIIILHICIGLFVAIKVLGDLQGVYLFFGIFRNPFYPTNCINSSVKKNQTVSINQNRLFFKIIKYLRIILIRIS